MSEHDLPDPRDAVEAGEFDVAEHRAAGVVGVAVAHEIGEAEPENREGEAAHDLVGTEADGRDRVHERFAAYIKAYDIRL